MIKDNTIITLNARNRKRLEELGYLVPSGLKKNKPITIEIKVSHLSKGSRALVERVCDSCEVKEHISFRDMGSERHCKKCSLKIEHSGKNSAHFGKKKSKKICENLRIINSMPKEEETNIISFLDKTGFSPTSKEALKQLGWSIQTILNVVNRNNRRDLVHKNPFSSSQEILIVNFLTDLKIPFKRNFREIPFVSEVDFYLPDHNLAIEINGLFFHSEIKKPDKKFHYNKFKNCKNFGVKLLTIWEHHFNVRPSAVYGLIKAHLLLNSTIYARKCVLERDKKQLIKFIEKNHIQGAKINDNHLGLSYNGEIVLAASWGKHHRNSSTLVLSRVCFSDYSVTGGAEKLLKHIPRPLVTWSDNCYSPNPTLYSRLGFTKDNSLPIDYFYTKGDSTFFSKQSQGKKNTKCPLSLTEAQWAKERGLYRVWDCGKIRWILE